VRERRIFGQDWTDDPIHSPEQHVRNGRDRIRQAHAPARERTGGLLRRFRLIGSLVDRRMMVVPTMAVIGGLNRRRMAHPRNRHRCGRQWESRYGEREHQGENGPNGVHEVQR
jgi:hypothetical protein